MCTSEHAHADAARRGAGAAADTAAAAACDQVSVIRSAHWQSGPGGGPAHISQVKHRLKLDRSLPGMLLAATTTSVSGSTAEPRRHMVCVEYCGKPSIGSVHGSSQLPRASGSHHDHAHRPRGAQKWSLLPGQPCTPFPLPGISPPHALLARDRPAAP